MTTYGLHPQKTVPEFVVDLVWSQGLVTFKLANANKAYGQNDLHIENVSSLIQYQSFGSHIQPAICFASCKKSRIGSFQSWPRQHRPPSDQRCSFDRHFECKVIEISLTRTTWVWRKPLVHLRLIVLTVVDCTKSFPTLPSVTVWSPPLLLARGDHGSWLLFAT